MTKIDITSGLTELVDFCKRAADATSRLASVREQDVSIAQTPREEIYRLNGRALYRIVSDQPRRIPTPVLLVYAMVGHWAVLDLQDDRSFVRNLIDAGCDVYEIGRAHV